MEKFEITLKNEKLRFYIRISWICILLHFVFFTYLLFITQNERIFKGSVLVVTLLAGSFFFIAYNSRKKNHKKVNILWFFLLLIAGWVIIGKYYFVIVPLIFAILNKIASRKLTVAVTKDNIEYPSFPKRKIPWSNLNNLVLKDGLLTIDMKFNKFIQQAIEETNISISEKEFNEFCRKQLREKGVYKDEPNKWDALDALGRFTDSIN